MKERKAVIVYGTFELNLHCVQCCRLSLMLLCGRVEIRQGRPKLPSAIWIYRFWRWCTIALFFWNAKKLKPIKKKLMKMSVLAQLPFKDSAIGLISCSTGTQGLRFFISFFSVIVVNIRHNDSLQSVCVFLSCLGKGQHLHHIPMKTKSCFNHCILHWIHLFIVFSVCLKILLMSTTEGMFGHFC